VKTIFVVALLAASAGSAWAAGTSCEELTRLKLPHTEITAATMVAKGAFTPPPGGPGAPAGPPPAGAPAGAPPAGGPGGGGRQNAIYATLPVFCRVMATLRPTSDSDIKIEVWLPADGWNGRLEAVGNGGFGSNIQYNGMAEAVARGYTSTGNNTGQTNNGKDIVGHPEKLIDWGSRAVHEDVVAAKAIDAAFYGSAPKYSYWNSCSTGGRQGWVAAEYYPDDFDGLAIGDPANPMTRLQANNIWIHLALTKDDASFISNEKWAAIHQWALKECDARDGLKDGLIQNPMACNLDVKQLACKDGVDAADCLTAPQLEVLTKIATGSKNPRTGAQLYPGYPLGTAMAPGPVAGRNNPDGSAPATFQALFQDANWDYHTFNFDTDTARADKLGNNTINAVDPAKLKQLFAHGGKLLLYHGWNDPAITPLISIQLYEQAMAANGGSAKTSDEMRLFMVPGMNHCGGGEGPNTFDKVDPLAEWVEHGEAPDQIIASHLDAAGQVDRTRPLCPYPQVAKYKGSGSIDDAQNFACVKP
jgi:feruloyl esterase